MQALYISIPRIALHSKKIRTSKISVIPTMKTAECKWAKKKACLSKCTGRISLDFLPFIQHRAKNIHLLTQCGISQ